jgi:hypothetical protein
MPEVVAGTAEAPGRYRVLTPFMWESIKDTTGLSPSSAWYVMRLAWFLAAWLAWHAYLRTWFAPQPAAAGTLLVAALLPLTYTNSWPHPDHIAELALFTAGCLAVARDWHLAFAVLLVLNALNRETAAFLVALYAVAAPATRTRVLRTAGLGALWAATFLGLRLWRGFESYDYWQVWRNLEFLKLLPAEYDPYYRAYAWFPLALFGPLVYLSMRSWRVQPQFVRRALLVVPLVALVGFTLSSIIESRIFTPVFALVVPGIMFSATRPIHE